MRRHYPGPADELLEGLQSEKTAADRVWRYPPPVREELVVGLTRGIETIIPRSRVLFVC